MLQETLDFFGLHRLPSQIGIFDSEQLRSTITSLKTAVDQGVGMVALLGQSGAGKTRLMDQFYKDGLSQQSKYTVIKSMVPDKGRLTLSSLLSQMIKSFQLPNRRKLEDRMEEIEKHLLKEEKRVILFIDEAHRLKPPILDQIRTLTDREIEDKGQIRKLLTIVLVAQAKLRWILRSGAVEATAWRVIELWLDPLDRQIDNYINWVLEQCGAQGKILSEDAHNEIKLLSSTPGEIKTLLWSALQMAYSHGEDIVSVESMRKSSRFDPNNLLAKINRQGFMVQDVALQADSKRGVVEKVLRGVYQGKADCRHRIKEAANYMLDLSVPPMRSGL